MRQPAAAAQHTGSNRGMASAAARGRLAQRRRTVAVGGNEAFEAQLLAQHLVEQGVRQASRLVVHFVVAERGQGKWGQLWAGTHKAGRAPPWSCRNPYVLL